MPTLAKIEPLPRADARRTQAFIREVIAAHLQDYASPDGWQEQAVRALTGLVPPKFRGLLSELLAPGMDDFDAPLDGAQDAPSQIDKRQRHDAFSKWQYHFAGMNHISLSGLTFKIPLKGNDLFGHLRARRFRLLDFNWDQPVLGLDHHIHLGTGGGAPVIQHRFLAAVHEYLE
jgi:hypothetical protein